MKDNQKAIRSGLEDLMIFNQLPEKPVQETKLPTDYKPAFLMDSSPIKSNLDFGFSAEDIEKLTQFNLYKPSELFQEVVNKKKWF